MALDLIYYGADRSHRVSVLAAAGYAVKNCKSPSELTQSLDAGEEILAILFCDQDGELPHDIVGATRARCPAPLILFRDSSGIEARSEFDCIIPNLTPPADWLRDIADQIQQRRRSESQQSPQPAPQTAPQPSKILPIDAPPSKIRLLERGDSAVAPSDLELLSPPLEGSTAASGTSPEPRSFI